MVEAAPEDTIIGIDLGTSNSCVAYWAVREEGKGGELEVI